MDITMHATGTPSDLADRTKGVGRWPGMGRWAGWALASAVGGIGWVLGLFAGIAIGGPVTGVLYIAVVGGSGFINLALGQTVPAVVGKALAVAAIAVGIAIGAAAGGLLCGSLLGGTQALILRRRDITRRWLAASAASMALATLLAIAPMLLELAIEMAQTSSGGRPAPPPAWAFGLWRLLPVGGLLGGLLVGAAQA